jgi:predicted nucleic acid-binding protein
MRVIRDTNVLVAALMVFGRPAPPAKGSPGGVSRARPHDDYLLAMAKAGDADYLVTGDKDGY